MGQQKPFFSKAFKRESLNGLPVYLFSSCYTQDDTNHNEMPRISVEGSIYYAESEQLTNNDTTLFTKLPEEVQNPQIHKKVYEIWLQDCSGVFIKPPTITQCLANTTSIWDSNAPVASINPTEEDTDWVLQWVPTKVKVCIPNFEIYWAPCYKTQLARIPELDIPEQSESQLDKIELQNPEKIYTVTRLNESKKNDEWMQEVTELPLPYSDSPTLRFDPKLELQQTKDRRRIRDARIRVKLARYRAERMAQRYEEKYGLYPEEDEEEGQTEAEKSDEE